MYARRTETPLHLLTWGSNPFPYAPDGKNRTVTNAGGAMSSHAREGEGAGAGSLESGLDNGPVMEGIPFNTHGALMVNQAIAPENAWIA